MDFPAPAAPVARARRRAVPVAASNGAAAVDPSLNRLEPNGMPTRASPGTLRVTRVRGMPSVLDTAGRADAIGSANAATVGPGAVGPNAHGSPAVRTREVQGLPRVEEAGSHIPRSRIFDRLWEPRGGNEATSGAIEAANRRAVAATPAPPVVAPTADEDETIRRLRRAIRGLSRDFAAANRQSVTATPAPPIVAPTAEEDETLRGLRRAMQGLSRDFAAAHRRSVTATPASSIVEEAEMGFEEAGRHLQRSRGIDIERGLRRATERHSRVVEAASRQAVASTRAPPIVARIAEDEDEFDGVAAMFDAAEAEHNR